MRKIDGSTSSDVEAVKHVLAFAISFFVSTCLQTQLEAQIQPTQVFATDASTGDQFGGCATVSGIYSAFGAKFDDDQGTDSGSIYTFRRLLLGFQQNQKIVASDGQANDRFGSACSLQDVWLSVGAPLNDGPGASDRGAVYLYQRVGTAWSYAQKLIAPDGQANDQFGSAVAIAVPYLLIGAPGDDDLGTNTGAAYVYKLINNSWTFQEKLFASDASAQKQFARAVAISGSVAIMGMLENNPEGSAPGKAYIFRYSTQQGHWEQQQIVSASDGALDNRFGFSVGISGNHAVVGAPGKSLNGVNAGGAYIYFYNGSSWIQNAILSGTSQQPGDSMGQAVAISGNQVLVGAPFDDQSGTNKGATYYFIKAINTWTLSQKVIPVLAQNEENFGTSVAIASKTGAIGSPRNAMHGANSGAGYLWNRLIAASFAFEIPFP